MSTQEIERALRVFIESGSSNGNEAARRECLRLVGTFAAAPTMIAALIELLDQPSSGDSAALDKRDAAISKARAAIRKARP